MVNRCIRHGSNMVCLTVILGPPTKQPDWTAQNIDRQMTNVNLKLTAQLLNV